MFGGVGATASGLADELGNDNTNTFALAPCKSTFGGVSGESPVWSSRIGDIDSCDSVSAVSSLEVLLCGLPPPLGENPVQFMGGRRQRLLSLFPSLEASP